MYCVIQSGVMYDRVRSRKRVVLLLYAVLLLVLVLALMPTVSFADDSNLTDLFTTDAFHGNWEVFTKMNIVGKIMSWSISAFGLIGIFTICMRVIITLLYLSSKNLWDNVDEIKSSGKNNKFFGMGVMAKDTFNAKYGVGLDAFVSFVMSLLPNIKAYSEYATDAKHRGNFEETDTIITYLLKSMLPIIFSILAFTMAFNGVLWQAYGTVVNACGVAASTFVNERLDTIVTRALNTGSNYTFGYSADGTKYGDFKQSVAKAIYNKVCSKSTDLSTDTKLVIGQSVDNFVQTYVDYYAYTALGLVSDDETEYTYLNSSGATTTSKKSNIKSSWKSSLESGNGLDSSVGAVVSGITVSDQQAGNLEYSVVINTTESYDNAQTINASLLGLDSDAYYIHLFISKKANSDETNYFEVKKSESSTDAGGTSSSIKRVTNGDD